MNIEPKITVAEKLPELERRIEAIDAARAVRDQADEEAEAARIVAARASDAYHQALTRYYELTQVLAGEDPASHRVRMDARG